LQFDNHVYYNCEITLSDGDKYRVEANWIHNNQLDYWNGWECNAGVSGIFIKPDFSVFGGECENDYLGNLLNEWNILPSPTICRKNRCTGCTIDLLQTKKEISK
jgi:hypothetical protein